MSYEELEWNKDEIARFLKREFPQAFAKGDVYVIEAAEPKKMIVSLNAGEAHLRPGGTVSGPALMELVDYAVYALLLAHHKEMARLAVTTGLQISFLRKADPGMLLAHVELIKHGRTLSVADVRIVEEKSGKIVAHSEATYYMNEIGKQ